MTYAYNNIIHQLVSFKNRFIWYDWSLAFKFFWYRRFLRISSRQVWSEVHTSEGKVDGWKSNCHDLTMKETTLPLFTTHGQSCIRSMNHSYEYYKQEFHWYVNKLMKIPRLGHMPHIDIKYRPSGLSRYYKQHYFLEDLIVV